MPDTTVLAQPFHIVLDWLILIIGALAAGVITYGCVKGLIGFIRAESAENTTQARQKMRRDLAYYFILALELLVAADVLETVISPSLDHAIVLGVLVLIRTAISVSLTWELKQDVNTGEGGNKAGSESH